MPGLSTEPSDGQDRNVQGSRHDEGTGAFAKALAFPAAARILHDNVSLLVDADPIMSNASLSAIAYVDALTSALGGQINQKDHSAATKLLRSFIGNTLPNAQERTLNKLLGAKDEVQYGSRPGKSADAETLLTCLDSFEDWAKAMLAEKNIAITTSNEPDITNGTRP